VLLSQGGPGRRSKDFRVSSQQKNKQKKSEGRVCLSIDLVCYRNIWTWKETHNLFDPDKLSVVNTLSFPRVNPRTQSSNLRVWVFLSTKRVVGLIGIEKSCPMFIETISKSIDRHDPEIIPSFSRPFLISTGGTRNQLISEQALFYCQWPKPSAIHGY